MTRNLFLVFTALIYCSLAENCFGQAVINEVQTSNFKTLQDENGQYEDWIEVYNPGNNPVDLTGYGLSDNPGNLYKFIFPSFQLAPHDHIFGKALFVQMIRGIIW
jgi:hypothetical protein